MNVIVTEALKPLEPPKPGPLVVEPVIPPETPPEQAVEPQTGSWQAILDCIGRYEGSYTSVSPSGKYKGRAQWDASTWGNAARMAGYGEWAGTPANLVPPHVQDAATIAQLRADGRIKPGRWPTPYAKGCNRHMP